MARKSLSVDRYSLDVFLPDTPDTAENSPVIYAHFSAPEAEAVYDLLQGERFILVNIQGIGWSRDMSPWPAVRAFQGGEDFFGGADAYLQILAGKIIPLIEESSSVSPTKRLIAGYSLAGLFSVYSLYKTDCFCAAASISGSLWYDDFLDFMRRKRPLRIPERMYFSLGDRERITRNQRLSVVEECTREAAELMRSYGSETAFELNPGNHFENVPERIARGIRWLIG